MPWQRREQRELFLSYIGYYANVGIVDAVDTANADTANADTATGVANAADAVSPSCYITSFPISF